jgi:hypothetical protein
LGRFAAEGLLAKAGSETAAAALPRAPVKNERRDVMCFSLVSLGPDRAGPDHLFG